MFEGMYTALVTPFDGGKVDEVVLRRLIREQIDAGVTGIVPCGSTGESATLSHGEHETVISISIEEAGDDAKVIAGTGSNNTGEAIELTRYAAEAGADGALLISPYYNKPSQEGLYSHYRAVAEGSSIPLVLYNIPGRTAVSLQPETVARLAQIDNIVAVKEASGSLDYAMRVMQLAGDSFTILSGDDTLTLPLMSIGGKGVIAVTANIVPEAMCDLVSAALSGDYDVALDTHRRILPVMQAMGMETNPGPVKAALAMMGKIKEEFRLPLVPMADDSKQQLEAVLLAAGLLED